jgi:hypothetical protein
MEEESEFVITSLNSIRIYRLLADGFAQSAQSARSAAQSSSLH